MLGRVQASGSWRRKFVVKLWEGVVVDGWRCLVYGLAGGVWRGGGLAEVARAARQLLHALALLHSLGIVHTDIKPDNLLTSPTPGHLILSDFSTSLQTPLPPPPTLLTARLYRPP